MKYYHITNIENVDSILRNGLEPFPNLINEGINDKVVYLSTTNDMDIINVEATILNIENYAVLEVTNLDSLKVTFNPGNDFTNQYQRIHSGHLNADCIRFIGSYKRCTKNVKSTLIRLKKELIESGVETKEEKEILEGINDILPFFGKSTRQRVKYFTESHTFKGLHGKTIIMDLTSFNLIQGMFSYAIDSKDRLTKELIKLLNAEDMKGLIQLSEYFTSKRFNRYEYQKNQAESYQRQYVALSNMLQPKIDQILNG